MLQSLGYKNINPSYLRAEPPKLQALRTDDNFATTSGKTIAIQLDTPDYRPAFLTEFMTRKCDVKTR
jgi:hypothetical protein